MAKDAVNILSSAFDELGRVFRHFLPGLLLLGGANLSFPSWFEKLQFSNTNHLLVMFVFTFAGGNLWYVLHRYSVHQLVDYLIYRFRGHRPKDHERLRDNIGVYDYFHWLGGHVDSSFEHQRFNRKMRSHVFVRSAHVIYIFSACEVSLAIAFLHEPCSFADLHSREFCWFGSLTLVLGLLNYYAINVIDYVSVFKNKERAKKLEDDRRSTATK
jgi:hypothetical protein